MKDEDHGGGGPVPPSQSESAKSGDAVAGSQVTGVVSGDTPYKPPDNATVKIRILHRIVAELHDSIEHHKRAAAAYGEALRRLRSQPPDSAGATAKEQEGDNEARTAHNIDERVKGKEEALRETD